MGDCAGRSTFRTGDVAANTAVLSPRSAVRLQPSNERHSKFRQATSLPFNSALLASPPSSTIPDPVDPPFAAISRIGAAIRRRACTSATSCTDTLSVSLASGASPIFCGPSPPLPLVVSFDFAASALQSDRVPGSSSINRIFGTSSANVQPCSGANLCAGAPPSSAATSLLPTGPSSPPFGHTRDAWSVPRRARRNGTPSTSQDSLDHLRDPRTRLHSSPITASPFPPRTFPASPSKILLLATSAFATPSSRRPASSSLESEIGRAHV